MTTIGAVYTADFKKSILFIGLIGFLLLLNVYSAIGQGSMRDARQVGMGRTSVALAYGSWHLMGNPSLMAVSSFDYSLHFSGIRNYSLQALRELSVAATLHRRFGSTAVGVHHFGDPRYREMQLFTGYATNVGPLLVGGAFRYTHVSIKGYESAGAVGLNFGFALKMGKRGWIGGLATNVNRPTLGRSREVLPQVMGIGVGYEFTPHSLFTTELIKSLRHPLSWRGGLEFRLVDPLLLRIGALTRPTAWTAGFGLKLSGIRVDLGVEQHQVLGMSYGISMGFAGENK